MRILTYFLIVGTATTNAEVIQNFYSVLCEDRIPNITTIISSRKDLMLGKCALLCQREPFCRSFGFRKNTRECFYLKRIFRALQHFGATVWC